MLEETRAILSLFKSYRIQDCLKIVEHHILFEEDDFICTYNNSEKFDYFANGNMYSIKIRYMGVYFTIYQKKIIRNKTTNYINQLKNHCKKKILFNESLDAHCLFKIIPKSVTVFGSNGKHYNIILTIIPKYYGLTTVKGNFNRTFKGLEKRHSDLQKYYDSLLKEKLHETLFLSHHTATLAVTKHKILEKYEYRKIGKHGRSDVCRCYGWTEVRTPDGYLLVMKRERAHRYIHCNHSSSSDEEMSTDLYDNAIEI